MVQSQNHKRLSPDELHRLMTEHPDIHLIHILGSDHFRGIHLPKALNACVFEVTFTDQIRAITADKEATLILYGSSDRSLDASRAAEKLAQAGYKNIGVLDGGIAAWRAAGLPVEGEAIDAPDDPQTLLKLENRAYRVDTTRSSLEWRGRNPNSMHVGNVPISRGELSVKDGSLTGTFDIAMNSITNKNLEGDPLQPVLIAHLESDDFFLTKLFPTARFTILRATPVKEPYVTSPNYAIHGTLELRGVTAEQDFMATIIRTADNCLVAEAHFDIDRTRWNIIYGSARFFEHMGMHLVFDPISIQLRIVAC